MGRWWNAFKWSRAIALVVAFGACAVAVGAGVATARAADDVKPSEEQLRLFEMKIRPVLVEYCYRCHSADAKIVQGGLRVDHREGLLRGGDTGAAIVPGKPGESLLIKALRHEQLEMPPERKLPDAVVQDFSAWIASGAPDPRVAPISSNPRPLDLDEGRKHWAFQPVVDRPPPSVKDATWPLDPLDHFLLARIEAAGIRPVADADRHAWLRRVTWDLTGLPPTVAEIEAFVNDASPLAYETVVDRLLASRAYAERWARHWQDLTGYADMMGTSNNVFAEHAWRYRDYLIGAFERDKPFDQFVREQIAGDLLPADSPEKRAEQITATGFLMVGDCEIVEPDKAKLEADHIDTQVHKIGIVFLGMTMGCARCHDHKFDPLTLTDYYGVAGMLRSSPSTHKIPFGVWSILNSTALPESPAQLAARQELEAAHERSLAALHAERAKLEADKAGFVKELQQLDAPPPAATGAAATEQPSPEAVKAKKESLVKQRDAADARLRTLGPAIQHAEFFRSKAPKAFAMSDGAAPADMPIYIRGNPYAPGAIVPRGLPRVVSWEVNPPIPAGQSGRLQLADWLAHPRNPLTPRVAVNRIWQKLFGEGLVRSVDYFGTRGDRPTNPELLDHLAARFVRDGWSQKRLLRSLTLSRAYRISSVNDEAALRVDGENRLGWRMNRQRLDAEAIRDGLLVVSGESLPCDGGPGLVLEEMANCGDLVQQGVNPPNYSHRKPRPTQEFQRSIYLPVLRTTFGSDDRLRLHFDFVNPAQIAGQRAQTVVPTQALFVLNNELFRKRAKSLADRLISESPEADKRLEQLWLRALNRPVTVDERAAARQFLDELTPLVAGGDAAARESLAWLELCHSVLASNEFLFRL